MARFVKERSKSRGLPPGSLVYIAENKYENVKVSAIDYSAVQAEEKSVVRFEEIVANVHNPGTVTWIDIVGLSDVSIIEKIGRTYGIHSLWLEDVLNTDHRPKLEELDDLLFILTKSVTRNKTRNDRVFFGQIGLFLGKNFVISFQEYPSDLFEGPRTRIRLGKGKIRTLGPDYLFYCLLDAIVDNYFLVLESLGQEVESIEAKMNETFSVETPRRITTYRNEIIYLRKSAAPLRNSIAKICQSKGSDIQPATFTYFKDVLDNSSQIVEILDSYMEMLSSLMDSFNSTTSHRMNEIMRMLTIFTSIFTPLTFIVGVYGMNFPNMPEHTWKFGYLVVWFIMLLISTSLLIFFKRKRWL